MVDDDADAITVHAPAITLTPSTTPPLPPLTPAQEVLGGACSTTMIATVRVGDFEGSAFVLDFIQVCVLPAFER